MADGEQLLVALHATREAAALGLWEQETWLLPTACGTAGCLAGNYALAIGCKPELGDGDWEDEKVVVAMVTPEGHRVVMADMGEWARQRLGLTHSQAHYLFDPYNSMQDLEYYVAQYAGTDGKYTTE